VVIDSGSTDGTPDYIYKKYPEVLLIQGNSKWWWTKAMYEGVKIVLRIADVHDYILELNNDCYPPPNYLSNILATAQKFPRAIIGSINVKTQKPQEVVEAGVRIHWPSGLVYGVAQTISSDLSYYKKMNIVADLDALPGKGTLIPIKVFYDIGNYAVEKLPHYIADYEFSNRAKRAGYDLMVDPSAVLRHEWKATGMSSRNPLERRGYKRAWSLLFGRNSMSNIVDWVNFIFLACPREYKIRNLYFTAGKLSKALLSVFPFYYLIPVITFMAKVHHARRRFIDLWIYGGLLMIVQFPKYHLRLRR
jgi:GT2 family glycosyltransferase